MILGKVIGPVVSTHKHKALQGKALLTVKAITPDGKETGAPIIAIDTVSAGKGDIVLVIKEGKASSELIQYSKAPVNCVIAAIVDSYH